MSAPSGGASGLSQCACTNISLMQLFHELKQQFPGVPDHVVSNTIAAYCHDKSACQTRLQSEAKASLTHAYLATSLASSRKEKEKNIDVSVRCPNQLTGIEAPPKDEASLLSLNVLKPEPIIIEPTSRTANLIDEPNSDIVIQSSVISTEINQESKILSSIDCLKIPNENLHERNSESNSSSSNDDDSDEEFEKIDSQTFQILKSNKVKCNLNEKLKSELDGNNVTSTTLNNINANQNGKPKRPCTLEFKKGNLPSFDHKLSQEKVHDKLTPVEKQTHEKPTDEKTANTDRSGHWDSPGFNVSVNLNCRMDLTPRLGYPNDNWPVESPKSRVTSVNLTVCTPTSSVASPSGEAGERAFEGRVTVTVNPAVGRGLPSAPLRRAPPPPVQLATNNTELSEVPAAPMTQIETLRCRQRIRLMRMRKALEGERARLSQAARETALLSAPLPGPRAARRLRDTVSTLRQSCQRLAAALDQRPANTNEVQQTHVPQTTQEPEDDFYRHIYTGQRIPHPRMERAGEPSRRAEESRPWMCHMCTFRNHGLLNECEECDMPRILVVHEGDEITVRVVPGRHKTMRSWVL